MCAGDAAWEGTESNAPYPSDDVSVLVFDGALTVRNAAAQAVRLRNVLADGRVVALDLSGITDIDLSFIQLVLAARRSAAATGGAVTLAAPAEGLLKDVLKRAGLIADGEQFSDETAFWLAGGGRQ